MNSDNRDSEMVVISTYTRQDALSDGELIDVTEWASNKTGFLGGFKIPVAFTGALFRTLEEIPPGAGEDLRGRAHDVLFMAAGAARRQENRELSRIYFDVLIPNALDALVVHSLIMDIGPGDNGEPVLTIGFPEDF
jgi:hypothetical protein